MISLSVFKLIGACSVGSGIDILKIGSLVWLGYRFYVMVKSRSVWVLWIVWLFKINLIYLQTTKIRVFNFEVALFLFNNSFVVFLL